MDKSMVSPFLTDGVIVVYCLYRRRRCCCCCRVDAARWLLWRWLHLRRHRPRIPHAIIYDACPLSFSVLQSSLLLIDHVEERMEGGAWGCLVNATMSYEFSMMDEIWSLVAPESDLLPSLARHTSLQPVPLLQLLYARFTVEKLRSTWFKLSDEWGCRIV